MISGSMLAAILALAIVIFVHELGHFLVAKWCGVEVRVFSMGFGPTLLARQFGETTYRLALIPLGGYVKMAGFEEGAGDPEDAPTDPARGFTAKTLGQRASIVLAGPVVNLVFSVVVLTAGALAYGVAEPVDTATIDGVAPGKPAAEVGLRQGDTVVSVDGKPITGWDEMVAAILSSNGNPLLFAVQDAQGVTRAVTVTPQLADRLDAFGEAQSTAYQIGVSRGFRLVSIGVGGALTTAVARTWHDSKMILETLLRLFQGRVSTGDLGGPILVVTEASKHAQSGFQYLLLFMALISVNLGVINLLPIPVLDGGHLAFMAVEALRGRPLSLKVREYALGFGMVVIGTLMLFVVFQDIVRIVTG